MPSFEISGRQIGDGAPVFIVAELSANHGQRRDIALKTIEAAATAGADAIKLQTYTPDTLTLRSSAPPFVVKTKNVWAGRTLHDLYAEAMTPWEWHAELKACAEANGLICFSTPFDPTSVEFLERLNVGVHKVASFELNDLPLVERIARTGKPMILSTGMASLAAIEAAVNVCRESGNDRLALLRCVSSYPARPESMDLRSIDVLRGFGTVVGLSDHTRDSTVAVASVALGAKIVEKHFILDRSVGGPDSFFSLEPAELKAMVAAIRDTEKALGRPRFGPSEEELASTAFRRSLFVARDVQPGTILTCDDVRSVRPADGMDPRHLPAVLGRPAARAISAGTPLSWSHVGERMPPGLGLRRATAADSAPLLAWRNDPLTRAMSKSTAAVTAADHEAWFSSALANPKRQLLVAEHEGQGVGTVRLDLGEHGGAEISLTVAPAHRGRGLAARMLAAAEDPARQSGVLWLHALVKPDNAASLKAFKRAGYYGFAETHDGLLRCERRLTAYR